MPTRAQIKEIAKQVLTGKWGKGALITLSYLATFFVLGLLNFIPFIGGIAVIVLEIPLMLGVIFSFIKLRRGEDVAPFDFVTIGLENFKRAWCLFGSTLLKMIAPIIVSIVIVVVGMISSVWTLFAGASMLSNVGNSKQNIKASSNYDYRYSIDDISYTNPYARGSSYYGDRYNYDYDYDIDEYFSSRDVDTAVRGIGAAIGSLAILGIVMIAMFIVSIWATCKGLLYALSYFVAYDNPNMTAKEAVQTSENLMRGNRGKLFVLQLSFIGWAILASITFGIGYLWLLPYMMVTLVCFYEAIVGNRNNGINNMNYANNNINGMNNMNYSNNNVNSVNNMNYNSNPINNVNNTNTMDSSNNMMNQINGQFNNMTPNINQAPEVQEDIPVNTEPTQNVNQYNPVTLEQNTNQYNQPEPLNSEPQFNPTTNENQINPMNNDFNNPNNNM